MEGAEFARRIAAAVEDQDRRYAFFLGAGCSVSSGIPAAGALVRDHWLPQLKQFCDPDADGTDWITAQIPQYDGANPAASYGTVMERLFLEPEDRQREIEQLCEGKFPGFGYAVLASLMSRRSGHFNVALTTNFDDLLPDAMYLFTRARPLVIHHESLASFIRPTRSRPLVVKLHGDQRLAPLNTSEETAKLRAQFGQRIPTLLHDRGLIFLGYGGNDEGITQMLKALPREALPLSVYWVSGSAPSGSIREWLDERSAIWVRERDFDETMLLLRDVFDLTHPDRRAFDGVFAQYRETYEALSGRIIASSKGQDESQPLQQAIRRADESAPRWWSVTLAARRAQQAGNLDEADALYERGLAELPGSAELAGSYALFLKNFRRDFVRAEQMYQRAIEADPEHANILGNYALFLETVTKDFERAEQMYQRAIEADPTHANNLGNYAIFLETVTKDFERAEQMYQRAIEADPTHANHLGNYATFLSTIRNDFERAEQMFQRALEANPTHANNLGNYATFLSTIRNDFERAEQMYQRAIEADPEHADSLGSYALFLATIRKDFARAERMYQRAIEADPEHATNLGNLATFLATIRKDFERAEQMYQRAIETDPEHANNLGNYAGFLYARGDDAAEAHAERSDAAAEPSDDSLRLELAFYRAANASREQFESAVERVKQLLDEGVRSPGWDLTPNLEWARAHPDGRDLELLERLAQTIAEPNR